jgi:hypothetical protein
MATETPERIWIDPQDRSFWNDSGEVIGLIEYIRVDSGPTALERGEDVDDVMRRFEEIGLSEGPTNCLDDDDGLAKALRQISPEQLNEILTQELPDKNAPTFTRAEDTNDAELWRYYDAIAVAKGYDSIPHALAATPRAENQNDREQRS